MTADGKKKYNIVIAAFRDWLRLLRVRAGLYASNAGGDISADGNQGATLAALAACPQFSRYVEIGTAHGIGSTKRIMNELLARTDECRLWSLESVRFIHAIAERNWKDADTRGRLVLLHGTAASADTMMTWEEVQNDPNFAAKSDMYKRGYEKNRAAQNSAPDAMPHLPAEIDVLLLDGGEFSSYAEYKKLGERAKVIFLDDSFSAIKNRRVREELLCANGWKIAADFPNERNGWAVFCRAEIYETVAPLMPAANQDDG